jgi:hypothetical protein
MKRGRPHGHVRLLDDLGRFEIAAWFAFTELGMTPYSAAYLVTFLLASDKLITTESVEGVLLKSTTIHATTVIGHADRIRRKAPQMIKRADEVERAWLAQSSAALVGLLTYLAKSDQHGFTTSLDLLATEGWVDAIFRVSRRVDASLRSNFPPAEGPLSRAAARLLRLLKKEAARELFTDGTSLRGG